jgi:hypothetical protein
MASPRLSADNRATRRLQPAVTSTEEGRCPMRNPRLVVLALFAVAIAMLLADGPIGPY